MAKHEHGEPDFIVVKGAREHNLAIDYLEIPKKQLVVFTGVSGSGKSSLAFDTLYAEGQRRYVESLSSYARQFLGQMEKPKYDHIRGLSPTIAIEQKSASSNPRRTSGRTKNGNWAYSASVSSSARWTASNSGSISTSLPRQLDT